MKGGCGDRSCVFVFAGMTDTQGASCRQCMEKGACFVLSSPGQLVPFLSSPGCVCVCNSLPLCSVQWHTIGSDCLHLSVWWTVSVYICVSSVDWDSWLWLLCVWLTVTMPVCVRSVDWDSWLWLLCVSHCDYASLCQVCWLGQLVVTSLCESLWLCQSVSVLLTGTVGCDFSVYDSLWLCLSVCVHCITRYHSKT